MCGIAGIVRAASRAAAPTSRRCCEWPARSATAGPDGFGLRAGRRLPGWSTTRLSIFDLPGGWQPIERPRAAAIIVYNGEVYNHYELRRELEARGETFHDHQRHRGRAAAAGARGPRARSTASTASSRSPGGSRGPRRLTLVRDRFGVRPLLLLAARRRHAGLRLRGEGDLRLGRGRPGARPARDRRRLHALGPAAAADRVSGRQPGTARAGCWSGRRGKIVDERLWW